MALNNQQDTNRENGSGGEKFRLVAIVFSLSTISLFTKVFGFAEKFVIAHFFGTGDTADVYFASTSIVLSIIWLVRELVYPSLLPVFAKSLSGPAHISGNLFRKIFASTTVLLAIAAVILLILPGSVTATLVPGFSGPKRQMTSSLLRMLAPAVLLLGLTMVSYTVLNARKRFLKAAWPEAALKLFIVLSLLVLVPVLGIHSLALAMGLGGLGCLLIQLYYIPEHKFLLKPGGGTDNGKHFSKVLILMGPLVLGVVFSHISGLVDNLLASTLPGGQLSYLGYSKKLIDAVLLIGPIALVTVVYSQLSHLASAKDYKRFTELVIKAFRLLIYLSVPVACILIGLRQPIIRVLFQRGHFTGDSTLGTSQAFMIYVFGLTTFSLEALLVHSFFALSDTKTPVKFGILCVVLDIAMAIIFLRPFGFLGIAGALVLSKTVKVIILAALLNRKLGGLFDSALAVFSAKLALSTAAAWLTLKVLLNVDLGSSFMHSVVFELMLPAGGASLMFVLCSYLLKISEFNGAIALLRFRKAAVAVYGEAK